MALTPGTQPPPNLSIVRFVRTLRAGFILVARRSHLYRESKKQTLRQACGRALESTTAR